MATQTELTREELNEILNGGKGCDFIDGLEKGNLDDLTNTTATIEKYFKVESEGYYFLKFKEYDNVFFLSCGAIERLIDTIGEKAIGVTLKFHPKKNIKGGKTYREVTAV